MVKNPFLHLSSMQMQQQSLKHHHRFGKFRRRQVFTTGYHYLIIMTVVAIVLLFSSPQTTTAYSITSHNYLKSSNLATEVGRKPFPRRVGRTPSDLSMISNIPSTITKGKYDDKSYKNYRYNNAAWRVEAPPPILLQSQSPTTKVGGGPPVSTSSSQQQLSQRVLTTASTLRVLESALIPLAFIPLLYSGWKSYEMIAPVISSFGLMKHLHGSFYEALSLIFLSELGDKTFFMAGLLAMKTSKTISFVGSFGALATMTMISVLIGQLFHHASSLSWLNGVGLSNFPLDKYAAVVAFTFFGFKTIMEARACSGNLASAEEGGAADEEMTETKKAIEVVKSKRKTVLSQIVSTFLLVFAAEFGDRSMLATIALGGASKDPFPGVALGAIAGHGLTTLIAVLGGSYVAKHIPNESVIGWFSGSLFVVFAIATAVGVF